MLFVKIMNEDLHRIAVRVFRLRRTWGLTGICRPVFVAAGLISLLSTPIFILHRHIEFKVFEMRVVTAGFVTL